MPAKLELYNLAVAELPAQQIASLDEQGLEARECRRSYPQVIAEMLAWGRWSFQNRRVVLAAVTNTRDAEWTYAYAVPSDMGVALRIVPDFDALGLDIPVPLPGQPYGETWASFVVQYEAPYIIENGVIYTNTESASLEYGINDITEVALGPDVVRAITVDLAARLAMPVKKDKDLRKELLAEAELWWQRAMANDANRQPAYYPDPGYLPEALAARNC